MQFKKYYIGKIDNSDIKVEGERDRYTDRKTAAQLGRQTNREDDRKMTGRQTNREDDRKMKGRQKKDERTDRQA